MKDNDFLDLAMARQEQAILEEVERVKRHARKAPKATGKCLYCEEPVSKGRRFCDADCAQDAERIGLI